MRYKTGTADVAAAGTRVQLSNTKDHVVWIRVSPRAGNTGNVYFGDVTVAAASGKEIAKTHLPLVVNFREVGGSVLFDTLYADAATNGDDLDWEVILS